MNNQESSDPNNLPRLLRITDIFIIIIIMICAVLFIPMLRSNPRDSVVVYRADDVIAEYPIDEDKVFNVDGELGIVEVEIKNGRVRVVSSTCPRHICMKTGWISKSYEQIICAPNRIYVGIESDPEKTEIDAVTH